MAAGQSCADDSRNGREDSAACRQRPDHGGAVRGAGDPVQHVGHRRAQRRIGAAGPGRHQEDQGPLQRHGQRRGDGLVRVDAALVLERYGELPAKSLVAMVPVSVHDQSDRRGHNQLSGMFCSLETHIGDPAERLRAIARADAAAKNHSSAISPTLLQDWAQLAARAVFGAIFRLLADSPLIGNPVHNLIVSNVPGPRQRCISWVVRSRRCIRWDRCSTAAA